MIEATTLRRLAIVATAALVLGSCTGDGAGDRPDGTETGAGIETDATLLIERDDGDSVEVEVAVADTDEERMTGLMDVEELGANQGMVFLHDEPTGSGFWMKNTLIPLSLAVWDQQGTILAILDMEPCEEDPCPVHDPGAEWVGALEVNQGFFEEHSVDEGDVVRLDR